jgi:hypothetical protein
MYVVRMIGLGSLGARPNAAIVGMVATETVCPGDRFTLGSGSPSCMLSQAVSDVASVGA